MHTKVTQQIITSQLIHSTCKFIHALNEYGAQIY